MDLLNIALEKRSQNQCLDYLKISKSDSEDRLKYTIVDDDIKRYAAKYKCRLEDHDNELRKALLKTRTLRRLKRRTDLITLYVFRNLLNILSNCIL